MFSLFFINQTIWSSADNIFIYHYIISILIKKEEKKNHRHSKLRIRKTTKYKIGQGWGLGVGNKTGKNDFAKFSYLRFVADDNADTVSV